MSISSIKVQICALFLILLSSYSFSQSKPGLLEKTVEELKTFSSSKPIEKVYLHFDKPYYSMNDTVWFKAYLVVGPSHMPSGLSKVIYADLINSRDSIIKTIKLPVTAGIAQGDFVLNGSVKDGGYRVRAYTQWMRNSGDAYFFNKALSPQTKSLPQTTSLLKGSPLATKTVPIRQENSIQFFPESGDLITGIRTKVAFKAINPQGLGILVTGSIRDDRNILIAEITAQHLGMGVFAVTPEKGRRYKATLKYADGSSGTHDLPSVKDYGYALSVNVNQPDSVMIKVAVSESSFQAHKNSDIYLIAQAGGVVYYTSQAKLQAPLFTSSISKKRFPSGIMQFTLLSASGEPLSERVAFLQSSDLLNLEIKTENTAYRPRQEVNLELNAKTSDNKPVIGSFSVSVINESKVPADDASQTTILSHLLLTSELKGYVEQPNYYFTKPDDKTASNLDLLMLTQGYRRFDWKLLKSRLPLITFQPDKDLQISGLLSTPGGKAIPGGIVRLYNPAENLVLDTISDVNGKFTFKDLEMHENSKLVVQGRKANDGKNVEISILQNPAPAVNASGSPGVNEGAYSQLRIPKASLFEMEKKDSVQRIEELKQVTITAKKNVKPDEFNYYGSRQERFLDLNILKDYPTVYDALIAKVVGFNPVSYRSADLNDLSGNVNSESQNVVLNGWITGSSSLKSIYVNEVERLTLMGNGTRYDPLIVRLDTKAYAGTDTAAMLSEVRIKVSPNKKKQVVTNSANLNGPGNADQIIFPDQFSNCVTLSECLAGKLHGIIKVQGYFYTLRSWNTTFHRRAMIVILDGFMLDSTAVDQLDPQAIASIEVLTSASSLAIYGSNARAGAFVVTSKRGNEETYASANQRAPGVLTYNFNGYHKARQFYTPVYNTPESMIPQQTDTRSTIYWKPDVVTDPSGHASFKFYNSDNKGIYKVVVEGINDDGNIGRGIYRYIVE